MIIGPETLVEYIDGKDAHGIAVNHDLLGSEFFSLTVENSRWGAALVSAGSFESCLFQQNKWDNFHIDEGDGVVIRKCTFRNGGGHRF